ncbi:ABC transporter ATP-binding protein [Paeniglutamicibacter kerguelensis]|uniref:Peptide/nickel transport system ATP-binding protein n=1 Tax=Paeniglutamicibacter kerguelensis TaxID=254788 RepID=A0ABS4X9Q6_9MICC|nr:ABC transporter ATP-binding protein [Paeniglutamicibacter kerguelensis]MBP2385212.1 peptide/nickel transport system ATP-binding protein [Paeniglutamicibacter kerguelensis]
MEPMLTVKNLSVRFPTDDGHVAALNGMDLTLHRGETVGLVGESGSGKSVTSQAIMGLFKETRAQVEGEITFEGTDLLALGEDAMRAYRGKKIGMIFQDPLSAMHPFYTVGSQIAEAYRVHNKVSKKAARAVAIEMLGRVGIPDPKRRVDSYPHEFSGGMRQRAMIAMALVCEPELLIADEPTTALDVTVQAQILDLISELQAETNSAVIFVTHDLGVVAQLCQRVVVMYGGQCVEQATVRQIFKHPSHPYTRGLMASMPHLSGEGDRLTPIPGSPPALLSLPQGCIFADRCQFAQLVPDSLCTTMRPGLLVEGGHAVRCHAHELDLLGEHHLIGAGS